MLVWTARRHAEPPSLTSPARWCDHLHSIDRGGRRTLRVLHVSGLQTPVVGAPEGRACGDLQHRPDLIVLTGDYVQDDLAGSTGRRAGRWQAEPGEFEVFVGGSSAETLKARFTLRQAAGAEAVKALVSLTAGGDLVRKLFAWRHPGFSAHRGEPIRRGEPALAALLCATPCATLCACLRTWRSIPSSSIRSCASAG